MFSKYQDKYTLWHDKEKGSNNWQNYSAMAKYLNLPYSPIDLMRYQSKCEFNKYIIYRHPNDPTPPISRRKSGGNVVPSSWGPVPFMPLM